jgi:hypothetical protein
MPGMKLVKVEAYVPDLQGKEWPRTCGFQGGLKG